MGPWPGGGFLRLNAAGNPLITWVVALGGLDMTAAQTVSSAINHQQQRGGVVASDENPPCQGR